MSLMVPYYQHLPYGKKFSEPLQNGITILESQAVLDLELAIKTIFCPILTNNWRIAWPSQILMPFLSFSDNFLQYTYIIYQKNVLIILRHTNMPKTCSIVFGGVVNL